MVKVPRAGASLKVKKFSHRSSIHKNIIVINVMYNNKKILFNLEEKDTT